MKHSAFVGKSIVKLWKRNYYEIRIRASSFLLSANIFCVLFLSFLLTKIFFGIFCLFLLLLLWQIILQMVLHFQICNNIHLWSIAILFSMHQCSYENTYLRWVFAQLSVHKEYSNIIYSIRRIRQNGILYQFIN